MQELYTVQDMEMLQAQKKKAQLQIAIFAGVMAVGVALSFWVRIEPLTIALTIVLGAGIVFWWDMKLQPVRAYQRFLREVAEGLSREEEGVVVRFETEPSYREGLQSYRLLLNVEEKMDPEGERQFFLDANRPRPLLETGQRIRIRYHGSDVLAWEVRHE